MSAAERNPRGNLDAINIDQEWEGLAEAAVAAYEAGAFIEFAGYCRKAAALLDSIAWEDPRCACTLNNLGLAELLASDMPAASRSFAEAGRAWRLSKAWVGRMTLESRARSSLFHLRLEQKHRRAFDPVLRARNLRSLTAARAASLFNRSLALHLWGRSAGLASALETAQRQRQDALGPRNPELSSMLRLRASLPATLREVSVQAELLHRARKIDQAPARSSLEIWRHGRFAAMNDDRHLLSAALLTVVLTVEGLYIAQFRWSLS